MNQDEITLDEFLELQRLALEKFEEMWLKGMLENPENFPATLPEGEWDEQLRAFED